MEMQSELMADQMDMMADPDQELQAENVYNQVLAEIGLSLNGEMVTGKGDLAQPVAQVVVDDDLQARLDALKK